jgi:hypothetical protein
VRAETRTTRLRSSSVSIVYAHACKDNQIQIDQQVSGPIKMISHTAYVLLRFVIYRVQKRNIFALAIRDKKKVRKLLERWRFQQGGWKWQLAEKIRTSNCAEQALRIPYSSIEFPPRLLHSFIGHYISLYRDQLTDQYHFHTWFIQPRA